MRRILESRPLRLAVVALALAAVIIGAQAVAAATAPAGGIASTGRLLGETGFAYLGGLRTFTAAVLWNRLEPQFHEYFSTKPLEQQVELLPTIRLVQLLDPQFEQAYYIASYVLMRRGAADEAMRIAQDGISNNPKSGLLRANYAQLLLIQDKTRNLAQALRESRIGMGADMIWASIGDQFEGYGIFRAVFDIAGDTATVARIVAVQDSLRSAGATLGAEPDAAPAGK